MKRTLKIVSIALVIALFMQIPVIAVDAITEFSNSGSSSTNLSDSGTKIPTNTEQKEATKPEPKIVDEDVSKREENIKHFIRDDHSYAAAVYPYAVHYKKNGQWTDIDNGLQEDSADNTYFSNKSNDFNVKFAKKTNSQSLVQINMDKYKMSWGFVDSIYDKDASMIQMQEMNNLSDEMMKTKLNKLSSGITYKNIYNNVDLEYILQSKNLKENIILNNKYAQNVFEISVNLNNLYLKKNENNSISAYDINTNKCIFTFDAPYMIDAKDQVSNNISLELKEDGNRTSIKITADPNWLNDSSREYPVKIDPTIVVYQNNIFDTYIYQGNPNTNFSGSYYNYIGNDGTIMNPEINTNKKVKIS